MKKTLGIEIDGIIRMYHQQFDKQYRKVFIHNPSIVAMNEEDVTFREYTSDEEKAFEEKIKERERDLITLPVDSFDLLNHYKFSSKSIEMSKFIEMENKEGIDYTPIEYTPKQNLEKFLYEDYPFQVFAMAEEYIGAIDTINKIQHLGLTSGQFEVVLLSTLKSRAIPATYSFLGKINCRIKKIMFVNSDSEKWNYCDAIVDIMPETFQNKPKEKVSIKINHLFNQWDAADYSFDSIKNVCNEDFFNRIFKINELN